MVGRAAQAHRAPAFARAVAHGDRWRRAAGRDRGARARRRGTPARPGRRPGARARAPRRAPARVRRAGRGARDEIRRHGEDAVTAARLLAGRPTLVRLLNGGEPAQLPLFMRRFCDTSGFDACAIFAADPLAAASNVPEPWPLAREAASEQGESFMLPGSRDYPGKFGGIADIPGAAGA